MTEQFIEDLEQIYQKAIKKNLLNTALKAKDMLAKYHGYFQTKNKITKVDLNSLESFLEEIENELKLK